MQGHPRSTVLQAKRLQYQFIRSWYDSAQSRAPDLSAT